MKCSENFIALALLSVIQGSVAAPIETSNTSDLSPMEEVIEKASNYTQETPLTLEQANLKLVTIPEEIKNSVDLPPWLDSWEDAEFAALSTEFTDIPLLGDNDNKTIAAASYLYSMTSGHWITSSHHLVKRDDFDLNNYTNTILEYFTASTQDQEDLEKRAGECFRSLRWITSKSNIARIGALNALSFVLSGSCDWIVLGRSAICSQDNGDMACVSWSGGWQSVKGCVAKAVLNDAAGIFASGWDDFSGYMNDAIHEWDKRTDYYDEACVSNRPNGCGSTSHQDLKKRYYWNDDATAWC